MLTLFKLESRSSLSYSTEIVLGTEVCFTLVVVTGSFVELPADGDGDKVLFSSGDLAAGASDEVVFTAPAPGEYNVLCTVPGHSAIMQGQLIVTA